MVPSASPTAWSHRHRRRHGSIGIADGHGSTAWAVDMPFGTHFSVGHGRVGPRQPLQRQLATPTATHGRSRPPTAGIYPIPPTAGIYPSQGGSLPYPTQTYPNPQTPDHGTWIEPRRCAALSASASSRAVYMRSGRSGVFDRSFTSVRASVCAERVCRACVPSVCA